MHVVANAQEPPGDRTLTRWRHKVVYSGSVVVRLASPAALTHVVANVHESLLTHQDGRQPNVSVVWVMRAASEREETDPSSGRSVDDVQGVLGLLLQLECEWMREVLCAEDTHNHPAEDRLGALEAELTTASSTIDTFQPLPSTGTPVSTAGMVAKGHDGTDRVTDADKVALAEERDRQRAALSRMAALVGMHAVTDEAMETIGETCGDITGCVPPSRLRRRVTYPFLFDSAER